MNFSTIKIGSKVFSGSGTLILENYKNNNNIIPSIVLCKDIRGFFSDFGGHYEKKHNNIFKTAISETREESANLINLKKNTIEKQEYIDIKHENTFYRSFIIKINGISRKYFRKNLHIIKENNAEDHWLEMSDITHVPIKNIIKMVENKKEFCNDIYGNKIKIRNRTIDIIKCGKNKILNKIKNKEIGNFNKNKFLVKKNNFLKNTYSVIL